MTAGPIGSFHICLVESLTMERNTFLIVKIYHPKGENIVTSLYSSQAPSEAAMRNLIAKFEYHGSGCDDEVVVLKT